MLFCMSQDLLASYNNRAEEDITASEPQQEQEIDLTAAAEQIEPVLPAEEEDVDTLAKVKQKSIIDAKLNRLKTNLFAPSLLHEKLGSGNSKNLSLRLARYMQELDDSMARLMRKYDSDVLLIDTVFESGNLLRADRITPSEYRLYMQVDTNTRGHQQWFYYRVRNTRKNKKYVFKIMNFTKPGITGGTGYRKNELFQRIVFKSKACKHKEWMSIGPD